jgi:hypothetical protein
VGSRPALGATNKFVLACSTCGEREFRAMSWHRVLAGQTAGSVGTGVLYRMQYCDMCAFCAIRRGMFERLVLREITCCWNSEMQMHTPQARANFV